IRTVERLARAMEECNKQWFFALSRLLLIDTQIAFAMERWKAKHGVKLVEWSDAWAQFEALNALGCYAHEHPTDIFPAIPETEVEFDAEGLGHPLLRESACVRNDVRLDSQLRFYLVSGSNMAGKSTLLRAIGVNAVLAAIGGPVRAA